MPTVRHSLFFIFLLASSSFGQTPVAPVPEPEVTFRLDGITFARNPGEMYLPLKEIGEALGLPVKADAKGKVFLGVRPVASVHPRLFDGTPLLPVRGLTNWGAQVVFDPATQGARVRLGEREFFVRLGAKRAVVDKARQEMRAIQGNRIVFRSRVSTGGRGHNTPVGNFRARMKERMHYSRLYNNSPMPYSVQLIGNIFVHGYPSVPSYPASHGCVRLPVRRGANAARWFYHWVEIGTPVSIEGAWAGRRKSARIAVQTRRIRS